MPRISKPAAPLRCQTKTCKYFKKSFANNCSIFLGHDITECRAVTTEPTHKPKGSQK